MKIVHICITYLDDFHYQENDLSRAHAEMGHTVTMISTQDYAGATAFIMAKEPPRSSRPYYIDNVKIIRLPIRYNVNYRIATLKDLYKTIEMENPEIIFFHAGASCNLPMIAKYKRMHPDCFLGIDFHSDYYNSATNTFSYFYHKYFFRYILKLCFKYVDNAYVITPLVGDFVQEIYNLPSHKLKLLPMGADVSLIDFAHKDLIRSAIRKKYKIDKEDIIIITGGKLDHNKKTVNLVNAFKAITNRNLHLIVFGSADEDYKKELTAVIADHPRVHYTGWLSAKEIFDLYLTSDIACFPGGQSVLWQHAICCGLPIIIKYLKGLEYLDLGGNVCFLNSDDTECIKETLEGIIESPSVLELMARTARSRGTDFFSYRNIAQTIIDDANQSLKKI